MKKFLASPLFAWLWLGAASGAFAQSLDEREWEFQKYLKESSKTLEQREAEFVRDYEPEKALSDKDATAAQDLSAPQDSAAGQGAEALAGIGAAGETLPESGTLPEAPPAMALDAAAWAAPSLAEEAQKSNGGYIAARYVFNTSIRAEVDIGNPPETASASGRAPAFAAAYGYEFSGSRLEAELSAGNRLYALSAGGKELSFEAASLFINGYADFATGTWLTPYIGAGFGVSRTAVSTDIFDGYDISGGDNTGWSIGYLITLGASAEIGGGWSAEIAWRRVDFGTPPSYSAEASQTGSNAPSFVIHQYLSATSNAAIFGFRRRF